MKKLLTQQIQNLWKIRGQLPEFGRSIYCEGEYEYNDSIHRYITNTSMLVTYTTPIFIKTGDHNSGFCFIEHDNCECDKIIHKWLYMKDFMELYFNKKFPKIK